jgi:aspartate/methionine/tyrosine aminotransferase
LSTTLARRPRINPILQSMKQNPIRELTKRIESARGDPEIISFGGGQPSLPPPKFVLEKADGYLKQMKVHRYTSTAGLPEVRTALAEMMVREEEWYDLDANNILLTQSGSNGIEVAASIEKRLPDAKYEIPQGAFYYFIQLPGIPDDVTFSEALYNSVKVATVPGSAFGMNPDGRFFRLTFVSEELSRIDEGIERMEKFVEDEVETPRLSGPGY